MAPQSYGSSLNDFMIVSVERANIATDFDLSREKERRFLFDLRIEGTARLFVFFVDSVSSKLERLTGARAPLEIFVQHVCIGTNSFSRNGLLLDGRIQCLQEKNFRSNSD